MNVGVVSPHVLTRKALCALLAPMADLRVVLDVDDALETLELVHQAQLDILIVDLFGPTGDLTTVSRLKDHLPDTKVLILSDVADEEFQIRAIRAGAQGCVSKRSDPVILERALKIVGQGEIWVGHQVVTRLIGRLVRSQDREEANAGALTPREWEILGLVANGYRNKEIASRLVVSENTVKTHLYTVYRKLQVSTRMGAALHYFQKAKQGTVAAATATALSASQQSPDSTRGLKRGASGGKSGGP